MFLYNIGKTLNQAPNGVAFKPMKADYLLRNFNYSAVANSTYFFIGSAWWMSYAYFRTIKTAHSHMWHSPLSHVMFIDAGLILLLSASGVLWFYAQWVAHCLLGMFLRVLRGVCECRKSAPIESVWVEMLSVPCITMIWLWHVEWQAFIGSSLKPGP